MASALQRAAINITAKVNSEPVRKRFLSLARKSPAIARQAMRQAIAGWKAETQKHAPVFAGKGRGQLRQRIQGVIRTSGDEVSGGLVFGVPYAIWLIAGTRTIAGGKVVTWKEGETPISRWPAKSNGGGPRGLLPLGLPFRRKAVAKFMAVARKKIRES